MTAREAQALLGKMATVQLGGMTVNVKIVDARTAFNRTELLLTPVSGSGETWKAAHNVKVTKGGKA